VPVQRTSKGSAYSQKIETVAESEGYASRGVSLRVFYRYPAPGQELVPGRQRDVNRAGCGYDAGAFERAVAERQQFILQSARKPLRLNTPILGSFTPKSLYCLIRNLTLNQRVQGSSHCASTNDFNLL
jgi:hypothetical protein